ncbi:hypothetical protein J2S74_000378 [Evansella vedderi]|uniref:Cytosine deaminase n=1 Tax=Evansella vedderi TaxID=38282 RepID=A0ABT9ZP38_9BACI|nr:hypothetical protein [Evansella vedderi]
MLDVKEEVAPYVELLIVAFPQEGILSFPNGEAGKPANFIILGAENEYEAIRKQAAVRYSIRNGKIIAETKLSETMIQLDGKQETVDFNK